MSRVTRREGAMVIGTFRAGTVIHHAPIAMQRRGVLYIAVHPEENPKLVTPNGIADLVFVPQLAPDGGAG
jgi:hypothetical protein